jgi:hypothetical protein
MRLNATVRLLCWATVVAQSNTANLLRAVEQEPASISWWSGKTDYALSWNATYDTNVFARQNSAGDFSTTASLSARQRRLSRVNMDIGLGLQAGAFRQLTRENFVNPSVDLGLWTAIRTLELRATGQVARSQRAEALTGSRLDSWQEQYSLSLAKIALANFQGTVGAEFGRTRYVSAEGSNLRTDAAYISVQRPLLKRRVFNFVLRTAHDFSPTSGDARDFVTSVGLSEQLFPKVTGRVSLGSQTRRSDLQPDPVSVLTANAEMAWNATVSTIVTQSFDRSVRTNVVGRGQLDLSHTTTIRQRIYTGWSGTLSYRLSRARMLGATNTVDRSHGITVGLVRDLGNNLSISLQNSWSEHRSGVSPAADFVRRTTSLNLLRKW